MRILFIIVSLLGLMLAGLGTYEFHAASEDDSLVSQLQYELMHPNIVVNGHKKIL